MQRPLIIILISAFLVSIAYSFYFKIEPSVDARGYDNIAKNLAAGNGYREKIGVPLFKDSAISRVGPGYQFFLAGIYKFLGRKLYIIWILQAALHALSGLFIYKISKNVFFGERKAEIAALISAFLYLFFVDIFEVSSMILTETLFLFLLLFSVFLMLKFFDAPNLKNSFICALIFSLAILTRPTVLPLLLILILVLIYKKFYIQAFLFLIIPFLIIIPWTARNYRTYHTFILTSSAGGINFWMGNNPNATGESFYTQEMSEYIKNYGFVAAEKKGFEEGIKFISTDPLKFIKLLFIKTSIYFSVSRPAAFWFHLNGFKMALTALLSSGFAFIIFCSGALGGIWAFQKNTLKLNLLLTFAVSAPLMVIPLVVETRYRYQIYPFLIIFGGFFLANIKENFKNSFWKKAIPAVVLIVILNSAFDLVFHFSQFQKYFDKII